MSDDTIDDMLDHMHSLDALKACTDQAVTERPPVAGRSYMAFTVHPPQLDLVVIAIGHCEGENYVVDLLKEGLSVAAAVKELDRYGIAKVKGAESDSIEEDGMAHAVCGLISILQDRMARS
jgi:hypothetical protein